jgi:hypothetical protein
VSAAANRAKSSFDPSRWMPPNRAYRCAYVEDWIAGKARWGLSMDKREAKFVRVVMRACGKK